MPDQKPVNPDDVRTQLAQRDGATIAADLDRTVPAGNDPDAVTMVGNLAHPVEAATLAADLNHPSLGETQDALATKAASAGMLPATRVTATPGGSALTARSDAPTLMSASADGSGPVAALTNATGALSRLGTGSFTGRATRTRLNLNLPAEAQQIDLKLQSSRTSVLADMAATRSLTRNPLPAAVQKLVESQGHEGRYSVNRPLAAGGMGAVLHIEDHDFKRPAAMKIIKSQFANHPEALKRFLAEAQITAQLEHPNIVPMHDVGVMADGTVFFTMKLIEGRSLGAEIKLLRSTEDSPEVINARTRWTIDEKLLVFLKVLDGVGFAHGMGVVHRDLKPDNIMLGPHGEVLVVDWGIAKAMGQPEPDSGQGRSVATLRDQDPDSATLTGSALGTLFYMPPEQAGGDLEHIDARSDVYALGATLYELLALRRSVEGQTQAEILAKVIQGDVTPLELTAPALPADLVAVVKRAMAFKSDDRYPSCAAMAADLRRFLAGQAVAARQRAIGELIRAWFVAHRRQLVLGAVAATLVAASITGTAWVSAARTQAEAQRMVQQVRDGLASAATGTVQQAQILVTTAEQALRLAPDLPAAQAVLGEANQALAIAQRDEQGRLNRGLAQQRLQEANEAKVGDLPAAKRLIDEALRLDGGNAAVQTAWSEITTSEQQRADTLARREAARLAAEATALLATVTAADPAAPAVGPALERARELVGSARKVHSEAPVADVVATATALATRRDAALVRQDQQAKAVVLLASASAAMAAGSDLPAARDAIAKALGFFGADGDPATILTARQLQQQIIAAIADRDRQAELVRRRQQAVTQSRALLERSGKAKQQVVAQRTAALALASQIATARQTLGADEAGQTALATLNAKYRTALDALVLAWGEGEGLANQAFAAVSAMTEGGDASVAAALEDCQRELCDFYQSRLLFALATGDSAAIRAFTNLMQRFSGERWYADLVERRTRVTVRGAPAGLRARPLAPHPGDGRLVPVPGREWTALTPGQQTVLSPAGSWELEAEGTTIAVALAVATEQTVTWAPTAPAVGGQRLRHVPAADGGPGFWLGETEVTVAQYREFVNSPEILPTIKAARVKYARDVQDLTEAALTSGRFQREMLPLLPYQDGSSVLLFPEPTEVTTPDLTGLALAPDAAPDHPITAISRDDAAAYCTWLAKRSGARVRLPRQAEWQRAAQGGESLNRIYPWGLEFFPRFCANASNGYKVRAVGTSAADAGPFGHRDLGGNAREWLAEDGGKGVLLAGGSWYDDDERYFRCDQVESAEKNTRFLAIGFRILVEIP